MQTFIIFILLMSLLVLVHELGHFLTARFFGIKVNEFGFGLPPRLVGIQRQEKKWRWIWGNHEIKESEPIVYSINWFPLGGFVKIKGENGEALAENDSFTSKNPLQKIIVLAAGPIMNFLLCILLLTFGFIIGFPSISKEAGGVYLSKPQVQISQILKGYPAEIAGLAPGDIIFSIDGIIMENSSQIRNYLQDKIAKEIILKINRNNQLEEKKVVVGEIDGVGAIGVGIVDVGLVRYPPHLAFWQALKTSWYWLEMIFSAVKALINQLFGGAKSGVDFAGPVGIAVMTGQAAKLGFVYLLQFVALLSLNLGIINLLPFPALDGGRIGFIIIASLLGKREGSKWENLSHNIGFILLLILIIFITYRDLIRYSGAMWEVFRKIF